MKYFLFLSIILLKLNTLVAQEAGGQTISALRKKASAVAPDRTLYITDPGKQGFFIYDPADKATIDDSAMTLVTADGLRFKRVTEGTMLNVRWFGATGDGKTDDWYAIQKGINYVMRHTESGRTLYFPSGVYKISKPLLIARLEKNSYSQVSINLQGAANARDLAMGSSTIAPIFNNTFAIGIQSGKGVIIKDLLIQGQFSFPNKLNFIQIDTLSADEWKDGSTRDNRLSPYSGIVIDPFSDPAPFNKADLYPGLASYYLPGAERGGSTAVEIEGCSIMNFIVGVMVTPSNQQNGELIDVMDCDISYNKVAYAMGQAQSKECHISRLKVWGATHTIIDNMSYGNWQGDGAALPMVDGMNIAGNAKQLCRIKASSFSGVFRNVYSEGLFRLGFAGGAAGVAFEDCIFDFTAMFYPDFFILGTGASFHNCTFRHYVGHKGMRLILSGTNDHFDGGIMNEPPVMASLNSEGMYPTPSLSNVIMYYSGGVLGNNNFGITPIGSYPPAGSNAMGDDPVYPGNTYIYRAGGDGPDLLYRYTYNTPYERTVELSGKPVLHVDNVQWTGWFRLADPKEANVLKPMDFIFTTGLPFQDQFRDYRVFSNPVGLVESIRHDTVFLSHMAYGIHNGMALHLWMDYYVYQHGGLIGDLAEGSNTMTHVQGEFPNLGDRLDIPMLPPGAYVTAVNRAAQTVRFSAGNNTGRAFNDYTVINGYPSVEMHSAYDLPYLQKTGRTLIGGARFYLHDLVNKNIHDPSYLMGSGYSASYWNVNSVFAGDTTQHKLKFAMENRQHN